MDVFWSGRAAPLGLLVTSVIEGATDDVASTDDWTSNIGAPVVARRGDNWCTSTRPRIGVKPVRTACTARRILGVVFEFGCSDVSPGRLSAAALNI